jgi:hypothetical protein
MLGEILSQGEEAALGVVPGVHVQLLVIWIQRLMGGSDQKGPEGRRGGTLMMREIPNS